MVTSSGQDMDEATAVFKALADPHRRLLLDRLHERDGQTLGGLCAHLPEMTRFGCMKHLRVLEEAMLVSSHKVGREKFHYLNPVPIQQLYDRWVGKYARPWTTALTGLKALLEEGQTDQAPAHVYEIYIRATPERIWQALTDPDMTELYYFNSRVASDWQVGSPYSLTNERGTAVEGEIVAIDPPRLLVQTWHAVFADIPETTVTWTITQVGDACKLTVQHGGIDPANTVVSQGLASAWAQLLSSLKSLLETGQALSIG
jgi:uncharacterized protein YndB with AHSA1/START domain/DNA-binding transcriptional ArsR family regulator